MSLPIVEASNPRIPRKKGQPAKSKKHSDLYTDEDPKGTIHGLGFKDVATAKKSVSKIRGSSRSHAHKIQAAIAMEQRARVMGKTAEAAIYRSFINSMKKKTKKMNEEKVEEGWSDKYKKSIDCNNPKGFSQKAHCQGKKKKMNEDRQIKKIVKQLRKSVKSHAKQADTLEKKITEGSLHKWFKGSKSKDGKGGWVNVVTGGTCASDEPGEGTPKCVSSAKRASMTKKERLSAARRKKRADPNQQQKSGAAKPTYVSTDKPKKKKMKESYTRSLTPLTEKAKKCWPGYEKKGTKKMFGITYNNCVKKEEVELEAYSANPAQQAAIAIAKKNRKQDLKVASKVKMKKESSNWRDEIDYEGKDDAKKLYEDDMKGMSVKSGHKRPTKSGAGMTQKGVEAYRRRNPGSKLKTAVTTEPSKLKNCLLYTSPSPRDVNRSRMPSSA